jgi:hypothetical protein
LRHAAGPLPPKARKRKPRVVIDTSVLVTGIAGFRKLYVSGRNPSADLLRKWAVESNFVWLVTEDILCEDKEVLNEDPSDKQLCQTATSDYATRIKVGR